MSSGEPLFVLRSRVYWSETDAAGIAHFTSFLKYCERTEEEYIFSRLGIADTGEKVPLIFPRVHVECDYKVPLRVHDLFRVEIVGLEIGRKSLRWRYRIFNESVGALSAECFIVTVAMDPSSLEPIEVPVELRRRLLPE